MFDANGSTATLGDSVSHTSRTSSGLKSSNFGYGELLPSTLFDTISLIKTKFGGFPSGPTHAYDFGSGSGRALFAACLSHSFSSGTGIEYVPGLHASALRNLDLWNRHDHRMQSDDPCRTKFNFVQGDLMDMCGKTMDPCPTLVIIHATLFDNDLFAVCQLLCESVSPGCFFLMVTKELRTGAATGIETLHACQHFMSWGNATVYIQRKFK